MRAPSAQEQAPARDALPPNGEAAPGAGHPDGDAAQTAVSPRTEATAVIGAAASVAAAALVLLPSWHSSALAGAFLLASVPAGAALMCWVDSGDGFAQAGLTLVLSLSIFALASASMIWTAAWHPRALLALAGAGLVSCVVRLARGVRR